MRGKVKLGVVGMGMGRNHAKGYLTHPRAELVAVCDMNEELARTMAAELGGVKVYTDAETMYREAGLHAVSVATPNKFHAPLSIAALEAGLHVLCEKPMAMTAAEAEAMLTAQKAADRALMINFSYRFSDISRALKQQVDAGVIGDIYFGRTVWHRRRGIPRLGGSFTIKELSGGGPLIDIGVHRLDLALWLMGHPEPVSVSGSSYDLLGKAIAKQAKATYTVEDLACGLVKLANGATLAVEASWAVNLEEREHMVTLLCGTKGGLVQKNVGGAYQFVAEVYTEEGGSLFTKRLDWSLKPSPSAYHEFVDSILQNRPPAATGEDGLRVQKILDGIYESAATGKEIRYDKPARKR